MFIVCFDWVIKQWKNSLKKTGKLIESLCKPNNVSQKLDFCPPECLIRVNRVIFRTKFIYREIEVVLSTQFGPDGFTHEKIFPDYNYLKGPYREHPSSHRSFKLKNVDHEECYSPCLALPAGSQLRHFANRLHSMLPPQ